MKSDLSDVWFNCPACTQQAEMIIRAAAPYLYLFCGACGRQWPLLTFVNVADSRAADGNRRVRVPARRVGA